MKECGLSNKKVISFAKLLMMSSFLKNAVPLYSIAISAIFAGTVVWLIKDKIAPPKSSEVYISPEANISSASASCRPMLERVGGYNYIAPLLPVETQCESEELVPLKKSLTGLLDQQKTAGLVAEASFYFRDLDKGLWTGYKENDKYFPGSLMKVPNLMSYLMIEEQTPGTLNTKLFYTRPFIVQKDPVFISQKLPKGRSYTVKELLRYMISYSDNNATVLLSNNFDDKYLKKILSDFHLPAVDAAQRNYPLSPREFSRFMRSIYNASYLSLSHCEMAAEMLSACDFKEGFAKGLPAGTKLIHKFGEAGNDHEKQLHESAIIYINGHGYLLTVMTKGNNLHDLANTLSQMAAAVNKYLVN